MIMIQDGSNPKNSQPSMVIGDDIDDYDDGYDDDDNDDDYVGVMVMTQKDKTPNLEQ